MKGRVKSLKEKHMKAVEATFLSLLEICLTKSWQAVLLCIAKQMGWVSEVEHWFPPLDDPSGHVLMAEKGETQACTILHALHILACSGDNPTCYRASSALWDVLHSGRTLEFRLSLSLCCWTESPKLFSFLRGLVPVMPLALLGTIFTLLVAQH